MLNDYVNNNSAEEEGEGEDALELAQTKIKQLRIENDELIKRCDRIEKEQVQKYRIKVQDYEEMERNYLSQEKLIHGYQKESERGFKELEGYKSRQKKLTEFLARVYGNNWESDLSLQLNSSSATPLAHSSPIFRNKLLGVGGPRPSFLESPIASSILNRTPSRSSEGEGDSKRLVGVDEDESETSIVLEREEIRLQVEAVQILVRGMEERLMRREVELYSMEERAKKEVIEVEDTMRKLELLLELNGV